MFYVNMHQKVYYLVLQNQVGKLNNLCLLYTYSKIYTICASFGAVVQLVEHRPVTAKVAGSSPVSPDL
jgi:hypothetical protein